MNIVITILTVIDVIVAFLLIALILVQQSKESGFGSAFGGVGDSVFGAQAGSHLTRLTVIFAAIFLILTLTLATIIGHRKAPKSIVEKEAISGTLSKETPKSEKSESVASSPATAAQTQPTAAEKSETPSNEKNIPEDGK